MQSKKEMILKIDDLLERESRENVYAVYLTVLKISARPETGSLFREIAKKL